MSAVLGKLAQQGNPADSLYSRLISVLCFKIHPTMITDKKKKRIESLTTEEMLYEINLGHRSRFQRENFAYLKTCYKGGRCF